MSTYKKHPWNRRKFAESEPRRKWENHAMGFAFFIFLVLLGLVI